MSEFKEGDKVVWRSSYMEPIAATVLEISKSGKRVMIRCLPPRWSQAHIVYVRPESLSPVKTVLDFEGEQHVLTP